MEVSDSEADLVAQAREACARDCLTAIDLTAELRERFPDSQPGYQIGSFAARALRRFDEADSILESAERRFPDLPWIACDRAWIAHGRGDMEQARRLAADVRRRFAPQAAGYQIGSFAARALRRFEEAEAIADDAERRFPDQPWPACDRAWLAHARGDMEGARERAADLRARFAPQATGYQIGSAAARALRRFDEADAIAAEAERRFPDQPWVASDRAWLAYARGDMERARDLAADLRVRFAPQPGGYQIGASAARALGDFDQALAILEEADARFPDQPWIACDRAWIAHGRGDIGLAIELMASLRARHPSNSSGYELGASMLRTWNRLGEAQEVLNEAEPRFSSEPWYLRRRADIDHLKANRASAARLVKALEREGEELCRLVRDVAPRADRSARSCGTVAVVVGMHRAGTSVCAKLASRLGFALGGPLLAPNFANPDGFQEHQEICESHEELLRLAGASWDTCWSVRQPFEHHLESPDVRAVLDRMKSVVTRELAASGGRWAFKDPRTAWFLPVWKIIFEELDVEPLWLLSVRDPRAVAASLHARDRLPYELGELLWTEHYLNALRHLGPEIALIVHYEKWFSPDRDQLGAMAAVLGESSAEAIEEASQLIKVGLRHNKDRTDASKMSVTNEVYTWLSDDGPRLSDLQEKAAIIWRKLEELREGGS